MTRQSKITGRLREVLLAVLNGGASREQLNHLVAVCHSFASSFIAGKSSLGGLRTVSGLTNSDLAFDSIADLFRQDERGSCVQLQAYFAGLRLSDARDEEIVSHLRRLVFSKVNQGIFRMYSESDPSLAKILRNLKLAVSTLQNFTETERFGETCLVPALCDTLEHLPPFDRDELEKRFSECTTGREKIPEMTAKLSLVLRGQDEYCRIIPLVTIAILIRSVYGKKESQPETGISADHSEASDAASVIHDICTDLRESLYKKYVGRNKLSEETFLQYMRIVEAELLRRCNPSDGHDASLFEQLKSVIPGITKEEYSKHHRNKIEYLLKLASGEVRKAIRD